MDSWTFFFTRLECPFLLGMENEGINKQTNHCCSHRTKIIFSYSGFLESVLVIWRRPWQLVVTALNAWSSSSTLLFDSWVIQSTSVCHSYLHMSIDFSWLKVVANCILFGQTEPMGQLFLFQKLAYSVIWYIFCYVTIFNEKIGNFLQIDLGGGSPPEWLSYIGHRPYWKSYYIGELVSHNSHL